ncbi:MAG: hypothetical protein SPJ17_03550 [Anaeroplasma sp.]|uniref:hypothetical protein n=1 Tax=Anaeroplasma sp. TaxID=1872523 RepID=UPI002A91AFB4|nr:hypothetical protein [Anaeroplasma sp.]MDY5982746.1 hypothetical protein [Anaeroplasma sp.]
MENKPQNVFDKLDKQGEQIEDISQRLEGISIEDLYALAKRTWDYEDYQTAQKYYNHISLLRPLDWEAPLYASLCNARGRHDFYYWTDTLPAMSKVYLATIDYILNLNFDDLKKEDELSRCLKIIRDDINSTIRFTFNRLKDFLNANNSYILDLENGLYKLYEKYHESQFSCLKEFSLDILKEIFNIINQTKQISSDISKEKYDYMVDISKGVPKYKYEELIEFQSLHNLSMEEEKEIKLNGVLFYEYHDKVLLKRNFRKGMIVSGIILFLALTGIIGSSVLEFWYVMTSYLVSLFTGILLLIKSLMSKNRINVSSFLCFSRKKARLTSNGDIIFENKVSVLKYVLAVLNIIMVLGPILFSVLNISVPVTIMCVLSIVLSFFCFTILFTIDFICSWDGYYTYLYKGKYYEF